MYSFTYVLQFFVECKKRVSYKAKVEVRILENLRLLLVAAPHLVVLPDRRYGHLCTIHFFHWFQGTTRMCQVRNQTESVFVLVHRLVYGFRILVSILSLDNEARTKSMVASVMQFWCICILLRSVACAICEASCL